MDSRTSAALIAVLLAALCAGAPAIAQRLPADDSKAMVVLVPFEEPGTKDPHAAGITQALAADLALAGIIAKTVAPMEHLDAVANAHDLCVHSGASALLIPDGRYEQTAKSVFLYYATTVKYLTHVELRLDEIDCRGVVTWTNVVASDKSRSGVKLGLMGLNLVNNVGAIIDACFRSAAKVAVANLAAAQVPAPLGTTTVASETVSPEPSLISAYLLLPFEQPGIADPRAADMTHSFAQAISARKINVKTAAPGDHLAAVAGARALCAKNGVGAIIVPSVRLEQALRDHAELRAALLSCDGEVLMRGLSQADIAANLFGSNAGSELVVVSERATPAVLDQIFPGTTGPPMPVETEAPHIRPM